MVIDPLDAKRLIDKAIHVATHGRPGPSGSTFPSTSRARTWTNASFGNMKMKKNPPFDTAEADKQISETIDRLKRAKRPVFLAGHGIRLSGSKALFLDLVKRIGIPVLSTFNGFDLIPTDHPLYVGRIGTIGGRAANFALQNSDLFLSVGSRNNIRQISYFWQAFARAATKIVVDVDKAELNKPTLVPDISIQADAGYFLEKLKSGVQGQTLPDWTEWRNWCAERKERYPTVLPAHREIRHSVDPYYFVEQLTAALREDALMVAGNGSACVVLFQAAP